MTMVCDKDLSEDYLQQCKKLDDLLAIFRVNKVTITRWRKRGLPHVKVGGKYFYPWPEIQAWIREQTNASYKKHQTAMNQ